MAVDPSHSMTSLKQLEEGLQEAALAENADLSALHDRVCELSGMDRTVSARRRLARAARERMVALGIPDLPAYRRAVQESSDELDNLIEISQVHETYFFRHAELWRELAESVLVDLANANPHRKLQIWSAGCATGDEAYSLAIVALESLGFARFDVVATDISRRALTDAQIGSYKARSLRKLPRPLIGRYFETGSNEHDRYRVGLELRNSIFFYRHNLVRDPPPPPGRFDLIVLRHVLMYMQADCAEAVVRRMLNALQPGGLLVLTPTEALLPPPAGVKVVPIRGAVGYRPSRGAARLADRARRILPFKPKPAEQGTQVRDDAGQIGRGSVSAGTGSVRRPGSQVGHRAERVRSRAAGERRSPAARGAGKSRPIADAKVVDRLLREGFAAADRGANDEAMGAAVEALDLDPMRAEGHLLVAMLAEVKGDLEHAITALRRALYCEPKLALAHFHLGMVLEASGNRRGAIDSYRRAQRELPRHPETWQPMAGTVQVGDLLSVCRQKLDQLRGNR